MRSSDHMMFQDAHNTPVQFILPLAVDESIDGMLAARYGSPWPSRCAANCTGASWNDRLPSSPAALLEVRFTHYRNHGGTNVAYSLFYTRALKSLDESPEFRESTPLRFNTLGEAITAACHLLKNGDHAWRIESPSGFVMEETDIEVECLRRKQLEQEAKADYPKCSRRTAIAPQKR
jgi:hypothetical protein